MILPALLPALLTGFALAFARAIGEYGSVVFISGNMPMQTEITPLLIITKLEQYDYAGATAIAVVMLLVSFACCCSHQRLCSAGRARGRGRRAMMDATPGPPRRPPGATRDRRRARSATDPRAGALAADRRSRWFVLPACSCPLAWCSPEALARGRRRYFAALREPDALRAIR